MEREWHERRHNNIRSSSPRKREISPSLPTPLSFFHVFAWPPRPAARSGEWAVTRSWRWNKRRDKGERVGKRRKTRAIGSWLAKNSLNLLRNFLQHALTGPRPSAPLAPSAPRRRRRSPRLSLLLAPAVAAPFPGRPSEPWLPLLPTGRKR